MKWDRIPRLACTQETNTQNSPKICQSSKNFVQMFYTSLLCNSSCGTVVEEKDCVERAVGSNPSLEYLFSLTIILYKHAFDQKENSRVHYIRIHTILIVS